MSESTSEIGMGNDVVPYVISDVIVGLKDPAQDIRIYNNINNESKS